MAATIGYLVREPALSTETLSEVTGQSSSSACRNIITLQTLGMLKASSHIKGRRIWIVPALIEALDEFALRDSKRTGA